MQNKNGKILIFTVIDSETEYRCDCQVVIMSRDYYDMRYSGRLKSITEHFG